MVFALLYALISLVNHYNFRTYALDLGAYTNALFDYIHFQWNDSGVFKAERENLLADHFDLYLIIFSPLSLIFKTYTLLLVQIIAVLAGGVGVYKYFNREPDTKILATMAMLYFYLFFGVFSAISFDYHSNVVAASLLPWFFYHVKFRRVIPVLILFILILVSKENVSLWMSFICLGLLFQYRKDKMLRLLLLMLFVFSVVYFVLITGVVMPFISNSGAYPHFHYSCLGANSSEALLFLISNPLQAIKILFINHIYHPEANFVKLELHLFLLAAGLPLLLKKPWFLFMLIPVYIQKLFHDNYLMWGIDGQYSIEFAPVMAIGIFSVISDLRQEQHRKRIAYVLVALTTLVSFRMMDNTVMFTQKSKIRFYQEAHYRRDYDVKKIHSLLAEIPADAVVSMQSPFIPHLSLRPDVYQFPMIRDATFIIFSTKEGPYPMDTLTFNKRIEELIKSSNWNIQQYDGHFYILQKRQDIKNPEPLY